MRNLTDELRLSILICTIPERKEIFDRLYQKITLQNIECRRVHKTLGRAEVLYDDSKRFLDGGPSIGEKRQELLDRAKGLYICYLDDDEDVSPDYVETLLRLVWEDKDVCTFRSLVKLSNNWALVDMKLGNPNEQINPETITLRPPWHVCPVKREFSQIVRFTDSNYGEDWVWFEKVLEQCKTEEHTDKIIHNYNHGAHSEADKIK